MAYLAQSFAQQSSIGSNIDQEVEEIRRRRLSEAAELSSMEDLITEAALWIADRLPEHYKR
jgi:hypothetical protein